MNGAALVSHDGGSLIAQDGSSLVSHDGGSVVSNDGGTLVAAGAGNAVPVPPALISQDGGGVVSNDGGTLISQDGSGLISQDGGGLTGGEVLQGATGLTAGVRPAAAHAVTSRAVTGSGYMDLSLFVSKGMQTLNLLTIRYTPGRRDLIIYQDPSVTLTPVNGTPAPITVAPVSVTVTRAPLTLDPKTHQPYQILTLKNTGAATLTGPVDVALTGLPATVTVIGAAGTLNSSPALTATGGPLAPGASVQVRVNFSNPGNARFSYGTAVYTGAL